MTEIPKLQDTGSTGEQESNSLELISSAQSSTFQTDPLKDAIQGLAASSPRRIGGEATANLMSASFAHISNELSETKDELRSLRSDLESTRLKLSQSQAIAAVLEERVKNSNRDRHLRNIAIAGGVILLSVGIDLNKGDTESLSWFIGAIGLMLMLIGWFKPGPGASQ